jgi:hypothetical protein
MNTYLLLRDNKQSGPYSVQELAKHGLKPYDLVWLEGKSAAWRYPSEIEELKPFAPVVEEQPFDRFYKKQETKSEEPIAKDHTYVRRDPVFLKDEPKVPVIEKKQENIQEAKISRPQKIHVSLPAGKSTAVNTIKDKEEVKPTILPVNKPVSPVTPATRDFTPPSTLQADQKVEVQKNSKEKYPEKNTSPANPPATVSKLLFRTVAAACLLLGGALIGLIINYNNQQRKFQQLNQLVEEIRHQDNKISSIPVKKETTPELLNEQVEEKPKEPVYKEDIQLPDADKEIKSTKTKPASISKVPVDTQASQVETPPVVLQPEEPVKEKISPELARRNLWQLVTVDNNKFKTGVFGGISNLELKVSNKSLYQLEQVEVEIKYLGPEKKVVNTQTVVFENVSPGEQLSLSVPKSSRGVQIDYAIKKINTKELGIANAGM